jgi:hypothetical protein
MKAFHSGRLLQAVFLLGTCVLAGAALPQSAATAVTLVAHPWATAVLDDGEPFVVPSTLLLEPGDYRIVLSRSGYAPVESTIRVTGAGPQHHVFHLQRR